MAKKTSNKELKPLIEDKVEVANVELPQTKYIKIKLLSDGNVYTVGYDHAKELINLGRASYEL